jgi:hypothetical protein
MSQQFIVQLPNKPGEFAHLAKALCARGVNLLQVHQTTVGDLTTAEIYTSCCDEETTAVLKGMGYPFVVGNSLLIEIEDTPCAFGEVSDRLNLGGVVVNGCCVISRMNGLATWALSVDNEARARQVLGIPATE